MPKPNADRNLLFGMLALQMDFITREQLIAAMQAWVFDKAKALGDILLAQGALPDDQRVLLEALVQKHLAKHDNNAEKSLAALVPTANVRGDLAKITDADVQASLTMVPGGGKARDPYATVAPSGAQTLAPGMRFRIVRPHARGGLGEVFVARDEELHREVALKEIQDQAADDYDSRSRFMLEAEITGGLEHPGIVPVYGLGTYPDGRPYYAMRFIRGDSLKDAIDQFHARDAAGMPPGQRALELRGLLGRFVDVCNAIAYAHSRGVLHRDLKPGNIMLGKYGETLVVDWGLAKPMGEPAKGTAPSLEPGEGSLMPSAMSMGSQTLAGAAMGTPQYMGPEQAAGRLDLLGPASDVYSLGATLYCLLTGRPPIVDNDVGTVLQKVQRGDFPKPSAVKPGVPAPLEAICLKALQLKPDERYATPKLLADDLEHWLADEPVSAWREPWTVTSKRWIGRHAVLVTGIGTAVAIALVALIATTILLTAANERERQAKDLAEKQRLKAEENFKLARSAVDQYHTKVSEDVLLKEPGMEPLRKKLLQSASEFYAKFVQERTGDPLVQGELGKATFRLAQITGEVDSPKQAIALHEKAVKLFETLPDEKQTADYTSDLAASYHHLGRLHREAAEASLSEEAYKKAMKVWDKLVAANPKEVSYQTGLARTQMGLGNLHQFARRLDAAQDHYQQSLKRWDALAKAHPDIAMYQRELAVNHSNLALLYLSFKGKEKDAEDALRLALLLQKKLAEDASNVSKFQDDLARTWYLLGTCAEVSSAANADVVTPYQEAAKLWQTVSDRHPTVKTYQLRLTDALTKLAMAHRRAADLKKAEEASEQAVRVQRRLSKHNDDDPRLRNGLALGLKALGDVYRADSQADKAEAAYAEAIALQDKLTREQTEAPHYQRDLAYSYDALGRLHEQFTQTDKAADAFKKSLAAWDTLVKNHPSEQEYAEGLADACFNLGNTARFANNHKDAYQWYSRALASIDAKKVKNANSVGIQQITSNAYLMRAHALTQMKRYSEALDDLDRTLALSSDARKPDVRLLRAGSLARAGRYLDAEAEVEKLKPIIKTTDAPYRFAGVYALAANAVALDERLSNEERNKLGEPYAEQAMKLLRDSESAGFFKTAANQKRLLSDPDLQVLRSRPEYKKLIGQFNAP